MKKAFVMMGVVASLSLSAFGVAGAQGFADTNGHWAQNTIEWGQSHGYISGYPDGNFKPDHTVSEAEFLSMLLNSMTTVPSMSNVNHWADSVYSFAKHLNYPLDGYENIEVRDRPITRTHVAELETATQGVNYSGDNAIKYVLVHGLASGKTASNVEGFQGNDDLTRAEAITFIKNLKDKKQDDSQNSTPTPLQQTQPSQTPTSTQTTTTDLSLDQMKELEMLYANSLSFDSGTLTGTPPVLPSQYEWNTVFSLFKKEDGKLNIVGWNKKLTEGEQFSFPVNWDDIQTGIFRIEIIDKRINVPDVTTLRHYETNQIEQHIN